MAVLIHKKGFALSGDSLLVILVVGVVAGWLAGQILRGTGFGLVADLCIGVIGAFIGNWLLPKLGIHLSAHLLEQIISATAGAIILLLILGLFRRRL
ncbi:MAG: GlsB/YeaQ/YmgE family stress response membrane protein [Methylovirgula sp.]